MDILYHTSALSDISADTAPVAVHDADWGRR